MNATVNKYPMFDLSHQGHARVTIVSQEMDGAVMQWIHYLRLHKYQWFFMSLSYREIEFIDEDNIEGFLNKANNNTITKGAQKKICLTTKELRERPEKLYNLFMVNLHINYYYINTIYYIIMKRVYL